MLPHTVYEKAPHESFSPRGYGIQIHMEILLGSRGRIADMATSLARSDFTASTMHEELPSISYIKDLEIGAIPRVWLTT